VSQFGIHAQTHFQQERPEWCRASKHLINMVDRLYLRFPVIEVLGKIFIEITGIGFKGFIAIFKGSLSGNQEGGEWDIKHFPCGYLIFIDQLN
jgi:hypothetical protein